MLLDLLLPLGETMAPFNVVQYITFRCACAAVTGVLLSLALGPGFIRAARRLSIGQTIREEGPERHKSKAGTPTMGGLLILTAVIVPTLLWADLSNVYVWLAVGTTIALGAVGFVDDLLKVRRRHNKGLGMKAKLGLQLAVGAALGAGLVGLTGLDLNLSFPFFKTVLIELGPFYIPFVALLIAGSSNAVNLTDGLDGLGDRRHPGRGGDLRDLRLHRGQLDCRGLPAGVLRPRGRARSRSSARPWSGPASASCGSTPIRRRCSWAIVGSLAIGGTIGAVCRALQAGAAAGTGRRAVRSGSAVRDRPGGVLQDDRAPASCAWRRSTITSNSAAGARTRSSCGSGFSPCSSPFSGCRRSS